jgi:hypothetical protein
MDSKRTVMDATEFHPFGELAADWARELGVEPAWLRRQLIMALQEGRLEPSPEAPAALALRDSFTLRLKKVSWSEFSDLAEARVPDIAPQLTAAGGPFDLVDVGEIAHEATLLISGDLVQRMGTELPKLVPPHVWYDAHWPPGLTAAELGISPRPSPAAGPAGAEKRDAPPEDAEVRVYVTRLRAAHADMIQEDLWIECRRRWPGLRVRRWREILKQLPPFKLGRPPRK